MLIRRCVIGGCLAAAAGVLVLAHARVSDAVTISPTAIYLSSRERTASFELYNREDEPAQVTLSLAFGYPQSDSLGRVDVPLADTAPSTEPSAVGWLRLYPQRVMLQPRQRQIVRIGAYPPDVPAGEYWARLVVRSRPAPVPVDEPNAQNARRSRLLIETVFVTAVNYRNGVVTTGVHVDSATAHATDSLATLQLDLRRTGNAAFIGRLSVELRARDGSVVARTADDLAVYHTLRRVVSLPLPRDRTGLSVAYRLTTDRDDLPPHIVVRAQPTSGQIAVAR